jgi:hypothetical protein
MNSRRTFLKVLAGLVVAPAAVVRLAKGATKWAGSSEDPKVNAIAEARVKDTLTIGGKPFPIEGFEIEWPSELTSFRIGSEPWQYNSGDVVYMEAWEDGILSGDLVSIDENLRVFRTPRGGKPMAFGRTLEPSFKGSLVKVLL